MREGRVTRLDRAMLEATAAALAFAAWMLGGFLCERFLGVPGGVYVKWSAVTLLTLAGGTVVVALVGAYLMWAVDFWKRWRG